MAKLFPGLALAIILPVGAPSAQSLRDLAEAPNHSRPASCVTKADIDAEDHPERDPQKGH